MELKGRIFRLTVDTLRIESFDSDDPSFLGPTGLDVDFSISKSLDPEPNCARVTIHNLSPSHRAQLEQLNLYDPRKVKGQKKKTDKTRSTKTGRVPKPGRIRVELEAGYRTTGLHLIFRGDLRRAITTSNPDGTFSTELEGEDGGRSVLSSRVTQSFPPGTTAVQVVKVCAEALGVGLGNILQVGPKLQSRVYTHGTTISGSAARELHGLLRRAGLSYSIQDGVLAFRAAGGALRNTGFVLRSDTGMVGSPKRSADGLVEVKALLLPTLAPGALIDLQSDMQGYRGSYMVWKVEYEGQSSGDDWYCNCELKPY